MQRIDETNVFYKAYMEEEALAARKNFERIEAIRASLGELIASNIPFLNRDNLKEETITGMMDVFSAEFDALIQYFRDAIEEWQDRLTMLVRLNSDMKNLANSWNKDIPALAPELWTEFPEMQSFWQNTLLPKFSLLTIDDQSLIDTATALVNDYRTGLNDLFKAKGIMFKELKAELDAKSLVGGKTYKGEQYYDLGLYARSVRKYNPDMMSGMRAAIRRTKSNGNTRLIGRK